MSNQVTPQPFGRFRETLTSATFDEYRSLPGANVESRDAFEEMRAYLLDQYRDLPVVTSQVERDGQVIDCVPAGQLPARALVHGQDVPSSAPGAQPAAETYAAPPSFASSDAGLSNALPASRVPAAAPEATSAPDTIPLYRTTLEHLSRFRNLAAFHEKGPVEGLAVPAASTFRKRYATGEQDVACLGGGSKINVWKPFVTPTFQASFSQQWYLAGQEGTLLQTVECGWHIDMARYGNAEPHLFVYTTRQTYNTGHSYYNEEPGSPFVRAANPYVLPGAPLLVSQTDGTQIEYKMGFYLTAGAWWFYFDDHPIGCYPLTWYNNGPLTTGATRIKFGGEVGSGLALWPPMGSGRPASTGFGKAAYQRAAFYNPVGGGGQLATLSVAGSTTGNCYTIDITNGSTSDWGTYLFFGGPGGQPC